MNTQLLSLLVALGMTLAVVQPAAAFLEDTPPTLANGGVDPKRTGDPDAVAAAQRALDALFAHTNREFSQRGYANPWQMREALGNQQDGWLDKVLPLACGRLVGGWKYMNWIPGRGWQHEAPSRSVARGDTVTCEFEAPMLTNGGANPSRTTDPIAVAAAQQALEVFYRETNLEYSVRGYTSPWVLREELGNQQSNWLDMSLTLARGQLTGGWKNMNWLSGRGWCHCAAPTANSSPGLSHGDPEYLAWTPNWRIAAPPPAGLGLAPRKPPTGDVDPVVTQIIGSLGVELRSERE
jgi:hypothetical protein